VAGTGERSTAAKGTGPSGAATLIVRSVPNVRQAVKWNSPFHGNEGQGWCVKVTFFRGTSLRPLPPGGTGKDARWINIHTDDLDETQMANVDPAGSRRARLGYVGHTSDVDEESCRCEHDNDLEQGRHRRRTRPTDPWCADRDRIEHKVTDHCRS
jgi:hypothetical protein